MKKLLSLILISALCVGLCACGPKMDPNSSVTLKWDGVNFTYNDATLNFDEYAGDTAKVTTSANTYTVVLDVAKDVTNITANNQGILEENMDTYKELFYYQEYLGSKTTGAMELGNELWGVCQTGGGTPNVLAKEMYDILTTIPVTNNAVYVNVADAFTFGTEWDKVICRRDKILILDIAQVIPGQVHPTMEPYTFTTKEGTTVNGMFAQTEKYDYYYYAGFTIQTYKGANVYDYISIN